MSDATNNPTTVTTPSDTEVRIEREFDAPRELVFEAYTDPELLTEWLGPRRLTMTVQEMDVRTGGSYRYTHADADGSYVFFGEFREVDPPRLLVQTFQWEGNDAPPSVDRVEFEELDGDRTRIVVTGAFDSKESRDAILEAGMEKGVREGYEKLDELLTRRRARR
ncbi:MAG TPA: SRPBCC family protein [Solirubrobacterales bacterium]|nr:SRPBCC family protein [Solirubrobacterales bacterium]